MALRSNLTADLIWSAFAIGSAPAVLAQTIIEAKTWDEAIFKLDCDKIKKNADGSFSISAVIRINGEGPSQSNHKRSKVYGRSRGKEM